MSTMIPPGGRLRPAHAADSPRRASSRRVFDTDLPLCRHIDRRQSSAGALPWVVAKLRCLCGWYPASVSSPAKEWKHGFADAGGLRMHYVEQGTGPVVLL